MPRFLMSFFDLFRERLRGEKMKWRNKGHEFDHIARDIVEDFNDKERKIYIFGAGVCGERLRLIMEKTGCFAGFIDNDKRKQELGVNGVSVISLQKFLECEGRGLIIIAADKRNIPAITLQLDAAGLKAKKDFYEQQEFMKSVFPILSVYANNQAYIELAQICLTERCTLKCKKCAHGCYAVDINNQDMSIKMAKESADYFFSHVDIIEEFVLIGGEPFLYKELEEIIEYIGMRYRNKIVIFSITTNGTIIPDRSILELCRKYDVTIRISDYSVAMHWLEEKYEKLKSRLESNGVLYTVSDKENLWMDYGFETVDRKWCVNELIRVCDQCRTPCREIRGSRFYYCVMARSISDNLKLGLGEKDYLDLHSLTKEDKKILLEYQMGFSEKGYLDMCNYCRGAEAKQYPIPAAVQV